MSLIMLLLFQLQPIATLKNHTGPVNGVSAICLPTCQNQSVTMTTYVATSSADSTVNIWKQENDGGKYYTVNTLMQKTRDHFN